MNENDLTKDFAPVSAQQWKDALEQSLKGKTSFERLHWQSPEGLEIAPFYNEETTGGEKLGAANNRSGWKILELDKNEISQNDNLWQAINAGKKALLSKMENGFSNLNSVTVNGFVLQNRGADIIQELAYCLAWGSDQLAELVENSALNSTAVNRISFSFGIDSNFFFEIAKLRTFRMLWANVVKQYQHDYDGECTVIGITALRNKADVDIHNNILRSTTEAMAAVLGGCDYIGILPFDIRSDETGTLSKRIARNIHHILKHEAHFEEVANAANGAWYIEHLTDDIAKKAWKLFQDIEVKGGFCECVESGFINAELATSAKAREERLKTGEQVWVGVNKYQPA